MAGSRCLALYVPVFALLAAAGPSAAQTCFGLAATITGAGAIMGTPGADVILGSEGPDRIDGAGGSDTICALGGNDRVEATGGSIDADGGPGNNRITIIAGGADGGLNPLNSGDVGQSLSGGPGSDRCRVGGFPGVARVHCEKPPPLAGQF
jgi:Ca2+-binding RTX toxin-like protein